MSLRRLLAAGALSAAALLTPGAARAADPATATSSNWSGYLVQRSGTKFRRVTGSWTVPAVSCSGGTATYSANWIGLGGASSSSSALEQLGTESDCTASGRARYDAWFEVVPAAASTSKLTIRPGDAMRASVTVSGKRVRLRIVDATRGTSTERTIDAGAVDLTSAEWIVEAPSLCSGSECFQTTVADFGTTGFTAAKATTAAGHAGTITDPAWSATAVTLAPDGGGGQFGPGREDASASASGATPGTLTADGSGFSVIYGSGAEATQAYAGTRHHGRLRR